MIIIRETIVAFTLDPLIVNFVKFQKTESKFLPKIVIT